MLIEFAMLSRLRTCALASLVLALLGLAMPASALPVLQLDIEDGSYDTREESIVSSAPVFTLRALGKKASNRFDAADTHYLSVAILPAEEGAGFDGSFVIDGVTYDDSAPGIVWGTPPIDMDLAHDPGDLGMHGVFPTYFLELAFSWLASDVTSVGSYNTQDDPGAALPAGDDLYLREFAVDMSGLGSGLALHFDLYNTKFRSGDVDIDYFAPFSHDASAPPGIVPPVPAPASLLLLVAGLVALLVGRRRAR